MMDTPSVCNRACSFHNRMLQSCKTTVHSAATCGTDSQHQGLQNIGMKSEKRQRRNCSGTMLTTLRLPMELDIGDLASLVDESVCVHTKALHVAVVEGHTHIIHEESELHIQCHRQAATQTAAWSSQNAVPCIGMRASQKPQGALHLRV